MVPDWPRGGIPLEAIRRVSYRVSGPKRLLDGGVRMSSKRRTWTVGAGAVMAAMTMWSCGGSGGGTDPCPTHASPTFQIGLSDQNGGFQSMLTDGQMVKMTPGAQGGCHLWIAFRTDGFARKGID